MCFLKLQLATCIFFNRSFRKQNVKLITLFKISMGILLLIFILLLFNKQIRCKLRCFKIKINIFKHEFYNVMYIHRSGYPCSGWRDSWEFPTRLNRPIGSCLPLPPRMWCACGASGGWGQSSVPCHHHPPH